MEQSTLAAIAAVTGFVGALGGLFAAIAAYRSADAAKEAARQTHEVERRGLVRDIAIAANNVIAETMRVDDLGNKLKQAYQTLATLSYQTGGSEPKLHIEEVERKQKGIVPLQQEALNLIEQFEFLRKSPEDELVKLLTKMEGYLVHARRVKEKFDHDLESVERDKA